MAVVKITAIILALIIGIALFTLFRNDANLFQAPGLSKRLTTFLTSNGAATADDHIFQELRTPVYNLNARLLYKHALEAATELGWGIVAHDSDNLNANFLVHSPVLLFEDDVYIQVQSIETNKSSLFVQSNSRVGRADFASNSGNIQTLVNHIKKQ